MSSIIGLVSRAPIRGGISCSCSSWRAPGIALLTLNARREAAATAAAAALKGSSSEALDLASSGYGLDRKQEVRSRRARKPQQGPRIRARLRLWKYILRRLVPLQNLAKLIQRRWKGILASVAAAIVFAAACFTLLVYAATSPTVVPYSSLVEALEARVVKTVLFEEGSPQIYFSLVPKEKQEDEQQVAGQVAGLEKFKPGPATWQYCARKVRHDEGYLLSLLRAANVTYMSAPKSLGATLETFGMAILTLWASVCPLLWLLDRQMTGNAIFEKKRRKNVQLVKFDDVAGVDAAKAELLEMVSCLKGASNIRSLGAKFPKGVLLIGPPGTGKTLLARALAGEAGVPFFATSASEFVEMFVGRGAARIRELFDLARKVTPSVIFIDELDAVGGQRGRGFTDERDQTLNQLLTEMDGFGAETGVMVLAATNRPEVLDEALCRPGRFSRRVYVREPDLEGRSQVLAVHMRNVLVDGDPEGIRRVVAAMTPGFVGADLANVVNEAALLAARREQSAVTLDNFKEAVYRSKFGVGGQPGLLVGIEKKVCSLLEVVSSKSKRPGGGGYQTAA